jgi:hypothetical protein
MMEITYPIYRKLEGFNRFYKIESTDLFIEISIRNGMHHAETIHAVQFPEKLRIQDMIAFNFNYVTMSEAEVAVYFH